MSYFDGFINYTFISGNTDAIDISKDNCCIVLCSNTDSISYFWSVSVEISQSQKSRSIVILYRLALFILREYWLQPLFKPILIERQIGNIIDMSKEKRKEQKLTLEDLEHPPKKFQYHAFFLLLNSCNTGQVRWALRGRRQHNVWGANLDA